MSASRTTLTSGFLLIPLNAAFSGWPTTSMTSSRNGCSQIQQRTILQTTNENNDSLFTDDDEEDDNEASRYLMALARSQTEKKNDPLSQFQSYQSNDNDHDPWYKALDPSQNLPFDCTGCGKCCKTKGEVYLSSSETEEAARYLDLSTGQFKQLYASHEEVIPEQKAGQGNTGWTVLKQKELNVDEDGTALSGGECIFLDENNMCSIYEARPLQCSTYPFWPRIMDSQESWNNEVVALDTNEATQHAQVEKLWTYEEGGCEGMRLIGNEEESVDINGISPQDADDRLDSYVRYKKRFPMTSNFQLVRQTDNDQ